MRSIYAAEKNNNEMSTFATNKRPHMQTFADKSHILMWPLHMFRISKRFLSAHAAEFLSHMLPYSHMRPF